MQSILFVNDDKMGRERYGKSFANKFIVSLCGEYEKVLEMAQKFRYDAVVLKQCSREKYKDIEIIDSLKSMNGYQNCPVFILAPEDCSHTRLHYLKFGIDDFFTEDMLVEEMLLRVNNSINRIKGKNVLFYCDLEVDSDRLMVIHNGLDLGLTLIEFKILKYLVMHSQKVVTRDELMEICWPNQSTTVDNSLSTHVTNLRSKLNGSQVGIRSIRGKGMILGGEVEE